MEPFELALSLSKQEQGRDEIFMLAPEFIRLIGGAVPQEPQIQIWGNAKGPMIRIHNTHTV